MTTTLASRKLADTVGKSQALCRQLTYWRGISAAGKPFENHNSQVGRIAARLEGLLGKINADLARQGFDILVDGRAIEEKLLAAHTVWEFFRSKLAQRLDETLRVHLRVCDEYAWQCYEPAREKFIARQNAEAAAAPSASGAASANARVATAVKEPPLTFLNGGWSPYAVSRDTEFQVERTTGAWLLQKDFREVIESLPVPLLGLPWFQVAHLPDVLVVAHEVGHIIEWDFDLSADLDEALRTGGLPQEHFAAWDAWRPELFADIYGCIAGGAQFASSVIDFLALGNTTSDPQKGRQPGWGTYPPPWLRAQLVVDTVCELTPLERKADVGLLAQRLKDVFPTPGSHSDFADDAAKVACALLNCPCSSMQILSQQGTRAPMVRELLPSFTKDPAAVAEDIYNGFASGTREARVLIAAARALWERDPGAYVGKKSSETICGLIEFPAGARGDVASEAAERAFGATWLDEL